MSDLDALLADIPWSEKAQLRLAISWPDLDDVRFTALEGATFTVVTWSPVAGGRGQYPLLDIDEEAMRARAVITGWVLERYDSRDEAISRTMAIAVETAALIGQAAESGTMPERSSASDATPDSPLLAAPPVLEVLGDGWEPLTVPTIVDMVASPGPGLGPHARARVLEPVSEPDPSCLACGGAALIPAVEYTSVRGELCAEHRTSCLAIVRAIDGGPDDDSWTEARWVLQQLDRPHVPWPVVRSFTDAVEAAWAPLDEGSTTLDAEAVEATAAFCAAVDPDLRHEQLLDWAVPLGFDGDPCDAFHDTVGNLHYRSLGVDIALADQVRDAAAELSDDDRLAGWDAESASRLARSGDGDGARSRIAAALAAAPQDFFVRLTAAEVSRHLGDLEDAEERLLALRDEGRRNGTAFEEQEALHGLVELYQSLDDRRDDLRVATRRLDKLIQRSRRAGRPARAASRSGPVAKRNDPCPCGSGRKYKHCCGAAA